MTVHWKITFANYQQVHYRSPLKSIKTEENDKYYQTFKSVILTKLGREKFKQLMRFLSPAQRSVSNPVSVSRSTRTDEIIPWNNGKLLHSRCPASVEPHWLASAGHNNTINDTQYLHRIRDFVKCELVNQSDRTDTL